MNKKNILSEKNTIFAVNLKRTMNSLKHLLLLLACMTSIGMQAQRNEILSPNLRSLQVTSGGNWLDLPVTNLHGGQPIQISFDDLTHEYRRLVYKVEHCEADWTVSKQLFESDYIEGFADGNTIDDMHESVNTNTQYTHYRFRIPNDRCRLKMSGNYRVTVYDGNDGHTLLRACFMVVEPMMGITLRASSNTDLDINGRHQQVAMELSYGPFNITNPEREVKTVLMQNGRWSQAKINVKPQYQTGDGMRWEHCRDYVFNGGNEYRKFEMLDDSHATMGLESVNWDGHQYHAYVWTDEPRPSYVYDESANGNFLIRKSDDTDVDFSSEYIVVHFRLKAPRQPGEVYVNGVWTHDRFTPEYRMTYNAVENCYETSLLLKQGYYSYQYVVAREDGSTAPLASEGNFYQTENDYQALVYYHGPGERTDRLVGYAKINTAGK